MFIDWSTLNALEDEFFQNHKQKLKMFSIESQLEYVLCYVTRIFNSKLEYLLYRTGYLTGTTG